MGNFLEITLYPVDVFGDSRIDTRVSGFSAFIAEGDDADLNPTTVSSEHQWTTGIALAGVFTALTVSGAQKVPGDRLKVGGVAILVPPNGKHRLPLHGALFATCRQTTFENHWETVRQRLDSGVRREDVP